MSSLDANIACTYDNLFLLYIFLQWNGWEHRRYCIIDVTMMWLLSHSRMPLWLMFYLQKHVLSCLCDRIANRGGIFKPIAMIIYVSLCVFERWQYFTVHAYIFKKEQANGVRGRGCPHDGMHCRCSYHSWSGRSNQSVPGMVTWQWNDT